MPDDPIRLVVDANVFISAFLKAATSKHLLLDERLELHAPTDFFREAEKDAPYLACALHLGIPLWSNDAELKAQNFVKVLATTELLEELKMLKLLS